MVSVIRIKSEERLTEGQVMAPWGLPWEKFMVVLSLHEVSDDHVIMAALSDGIFEKDLLTVLQEYAQQQEKRRSLSSLNEDGFIIVVKESVWPNLFGQYFMQLGQSEQFESDFEDDDMLFYVTCNSRTAEQEVVVFRKGSKNVPGLGDPHINWEETVYLNLIMHQIDYTLTCSVCTRLPNHDLQIIKKASVKIYASPHGRRMDSKGEESSLSYPNLFFMIDTYDEVFKSFCVRDDEMVCVELVAKYKENGNKTVIFLGSVGYDALRKVYESKSSFGTKMAQKMSLGWMSADQDHIEFIRMRGPHGKGFAEMAISQYKPHENEATSNAKGSNGNNEQCCQCASTSARGIKKHHASMKCTICGLRKEDNDHSESSVLGSFKWLRTRKKSSVVLGTRLTYVNLPWSRIMRDVLETRQGPVFTK